MGVTVLIAQNLFAQFTTETEITVDTRMTLVGRVCLGVTRPIRVLPINSEGLILKILIWLC